MKNYIIQASDNRWSGAITVGYNEDGRLQSVAFDTDHAAEALATIFQGLPKTTDEIEAFAKFLLPSKKPAYIVTETVTVPTFEEFWRAFVPLNGGRKGNKKAAEKAWAKLPDGEKVKAMGHLKIYRSEKTQSGQFSCNVSTYLNGYEWDN